MKFTITISRDEDGMCIAECPSIPGCVSQGTTEDEAQLNIQDAIRQTLEVALNLECLYQFPYDKSTSLYRCRQFLFSHHRQ